jgi:hypothetical protein
MNNSVKSEHNEEGHQDAATRSNTMEEDILTSTGGSESLEEQAAVVI